MGGCCSSSRKLQLHGTPVYYYYPPTSPPSDEPTPLTSRNGGVSTVFTSGLLLDLNLNMSIPDTYRPPPPPMPYDVVLGHPQSKDVVSGVTITGDRLEKHSCMDIKEANCKRKSDFLPPSPRKSDIEHLKANTTLTVSATDEEDVCPTCFEEYDLENPKTMTKCNHHFHLSCILEWMERSDTCPVCDQEMIYESP